LRTRSPAALGGKNNDQSVSITLEI
jgi:hypothetical protein